MYSWEKERRVKDQAELAALKATLPFTGCTCSQFLRQLSGSRRRASRHMLTHADSAISRHLWPKVDPLQNPSGSVGAL